MGFFKESTETTSNKNIARLHKLIWTLIFGGLLAVVLGIFVQRLHDPMGWSMVVFGGLCAAAGALLIYVRSKLSTSP